MTNKIYIVTCRICKKDFMLITSTDRIPHDDICLPCVAIEGMKGITLRDILNSRNEAVVKAFAGYRPEAYEPIIRTESID